MRMQLMTASVKDALSACERCPFTIQKTAFRNVKDRLLLYRDL